MSPSDDSPTSTLARLATSVEREVDAVAAASLTASPVDEDTIRRLVSAAARLHARHSEQHGLLDPLREDVSPTEAVDLACALLRARDLTPFELALWFRRAA